MDYERGIKLGLRLQRKPEPKAGNGQGQRIEIEITSPRGRATGRYRLRLVVKRYAGLRCNDAELGIKSPGITHARLLQRQR